MPSLPARDAPQRRCWRNCNATRVESLERSTDEHDNGCMIDDRADLMAPAVPAASSVVALVDASSRIERQLIGEWLTAGGIATELGIDAPVTQVDLAADAVATELIGRRDDPLVVPLRVLWLPRESNGVRRMTFGDVLTFSNPRKPHRFLQQRLVATAPDRHRVLAGAPARLEDMRSAQTRRTGSSRSLARAIVRAGVVALDRAERGVIGDRYKVPRLVVEEILDSPRVLRRLDALAGHNGWGFADVYARADRALRELVAAQSPVVSDLFSQAMRPVHAWTWKVDDDRSGLDRLRQLNRRYPLVFLPSHRSYVDAFVLGDVLARNDFPPNHVIGGANLRFWPMGPLARRTGTVFIRRSFGDDEVYKTIVEEYFAFLLSKRFNLEWYFEGGRTRTGKLRTPRYGLLNYLAAAIRNDRVDDVMMVPVSITYERLNELGAIATEQAGGTKQPEGLTWLARYVHNQRHSAGHVYVRFGEALPARERLAAHGDPLLPEPAPGMPVAEQRRSQERTAVQRLAFEVAVGIDAVTPITVNALVTLVLLGVDERALTLGEVRAALAPVRAYIAQRELPVGELDTLDDDRGLIVVLDQLWRAKVVTVYRGGLEPVYSIESGAHLVAAFYRNNAVHWFVNRAILELAILAAVDAPTDQQRQVGWDAAYRLRDLLKFEFFHPERAEFAAALTAEMLLVDPQWPHRRPESTVGTDILERLTDSGFIMAHRALRSFFEAQLVVAQRLAAYGAGSPPATEQLLTECLTVGRQMLLQQRLHSPESVSTELFTSAVKLADNQELLGAGGSELAARRKAFAEELRVLSGRLSRAAALDPSNRRDLP